MILKINGIHEVSICDNLTKVSHCAVRRLCEPWRGRERKRERGGEGERDINSSINHLTSLFVSGHSCRVS